MKQTVKDRAEAYRKDMFILDGDQVSFDSIDIGSARYVAFKAGAEWQANHVFTEELPPMDKPIVLIYGDGGEDDCDIGHHTGLNYVNKMGEQVDEHVIGWIPIPKINE